MARPTVLPLFATSPTRHFAHWERALREVARRPNVVCKLGGVLGRGAAYNYVDAADPPDSHLLAAIRRRRAARRSRGGRSPPGVDGYAAPKRQEDNPAVPLVSALSPASTSTNRSVMAPPVRTVSGHARRGYPDRPALSLFGGASFGVTSATVMKVVAEHKWRIGWMS